jgi:hypothetical protein
MKYMEFEYPVIPVQEVLPTVYKIHDFIIDSEWEVARERNPSR